MIYYFKQKAELANEIMNRVKRKEKKCFFIFIVYSGLFFYSFQSFVSIGRKYSHIQITHTLVFFFLEHYLTVLNASEL